MQELTRSWIVSGKVQGVSFRAFARRHALKLGIRGYAQNLPDGTVRVVAHGKETALNALCQKIGHGPRRARVETVIETPPPAQSLAVLSSGVSDLPKRGFLIK